VCENDWASENPVETAKEFVGKLQNALRRIYIDKFWNDQYNINHFLK